MAQAATLNWYEFRPVIPISTTAAFFTIPSFSVNVERNYLNFNATSGTQIAQVVSVGINVARGYTIEVRVRPEVADQTGAIVDLYSDATHFGNVTISSGFATFTFHLGGTTYLAQSGVKLTVGQWSNIAATISAAGQLTIIDPSGSYAGGVVPVFNLTSPTVTVGNTFGGTAQLMGGVEYVRLWNYERTTEIVRDQNKYFIDDTTGMQALWRFQEGSGTTIADGSGNGNGLTISASGGASLPSWLPDDLFWPGASTIFKQWSIAATNRFSIPTFTKPAGVNYLLAVRWIDSNGIVQRFKLWDHVDAVLNSPLYDGRVIEEAFELEAWTIRGVPTFSQATDLNITSSIRTTTSLYSAIPTDYLDVAAVADGPAAFTLLDSTTGEASLPLA